jgi:hypothetical protein
MVITLETKLNLSHKGGTTLVECHKSGMENYIELEKFVVDYENNNVVGKAILTMLTSNTHYANKQYSLC